MKFMTYILRNARRNPVRSFLTVASTGITLTLMTILVSFFSLNDVSTNASKKYNRIITLNAQGFAGIVPLASVKALGAIDGVEATSSFSWFGGKYLEEQIPFAQFGVDQTASALQAALCACQRSVRAVAAAGRGSACSKAATCARLRPMSPAMQWSVCRLQ